MSASDSSLFIGWWTSHSYGDPSLFFSGWLINIVLVSDCPCCIDIIVILCWCNDWSAKNSQKYFWALLNHNEVEIKNFQIPVVNEIWYRLKNPILGIQCWRIGQDLIKNFYKEFVLCWNLSFPFFLFFFIHFPFITPNSPHRYLAFRWNPNQYRRFFKL